MLLIMTTQLYVCNVYVLQLIMSGHIFNQKLNANKMHNNDYAITIMCVYY